MYTVFELIVLKCYFGTVIYSKESNLEDRILELVANERMALKSIYENLGRKDSLSLRAVYKSVNKLIAAGVILKVGKQVMIDHEWARRVSDRLVTPTAPLLANKERAVYTFVTMEHLDAFWKTVVLPLEQATSANEIFFYNPHNFWAYLPARKASEDAYYQHFSDTGRHGFFTIGGNSRADTEFKRGYQNEHLQIDLRDIALFRRTDHVTILDSMIVTVRLSNAVSERIDKLYASGKSLEDIFPEIVRICQKPGKIRFMLENDSTKAGKLKKVLARNFYFKLSE